MSSGSLLEICLAGFVDTLEFHPILVTDVFGFMVRRCAD